MTTPNIEELIASLTQTNQFHESADICTADVIDVLKFQAERIAKLEATQLHNGKSAEHWNKLAVMRYQENCVVKAERDNLRQELKTALEGWKCECSTDDACRFARERDKLREKYNDTYGALDDAARENTSLRAQLEESISNHEACKSANSMLLDEIAAIAATEPVFYEYQWTNPGNQPHQPESMFVWARVEPAWNGTVQQKVDELLAYRYDDKPTYRVRALFTHPMPAQDVKDAERYRWLREQHWSTDTIAVVLNPKQAVKLGYVCPSDSLLDETIDAAIAKGAK